MVAGETLIVPVRAKVGDLASIYSFNGTGSLIWNLLESPRTVGQLARRSRRRYEVEPAQAEQDVTDFVSEMKSCGSGRGPGAGGNGRGLKDQWGGKDWQQREHEISRKRLESQSALRRKSEMLPCFQTGGGFGAVKLRCVQRGSAPAPGRPARADCRFRSK